MRDVTLVGERLMETLMYGCFPSYVEGDKPLNSESEKIVYADYCTHKVIETKLEGYALGHLDDPAETSALEGVYNVMDTIESTDEYWVNIYHAIVKAHLHYVCSREERANAILSDIKDAFKDSGEIRTSKHFIRYLEVRFNCLWGLINRKEAPVIWEKYLSKYRPFTYSNVSGRYWLEILLKELVTFYASGGSVISFKDLKSRLKSEREALIEVGCFLLNSFNQRYVDQSFFSEFSEYFNKEVVSVVNGKHDFPNANADNESYETFVIIAFDGLAKTKYRQTLVQPSLMKKLLISSSRDTYRSQKILRIFIKKLIDFGEYDEALSALRAFLQDIKKSKEQNNGYIDDILSIIELYSFCMLKFNPLVSTGLSSNNDKKFAYLKLSQITENLDHFSSQLMNYIFEIENVCELRYDDEASENNLSFLLEVTNSNSFSGYDLLKNIVSRGWFSLSYYYYYLACNCATTSDHLQSLKGKMLFYLKNSLTLNLRINDTYLFDYILCLSNCGFYEDALKLSKYTLNYYPESFKTWNLFVLLLSALEAKERDETHTGTNTSIQVSVHVHDESIVDNGHEKVNNGFSENNTMGNDEIKGRKYNLIKYINDALTVAALFLEKHDKNRSQIPYKIRYDILQLKLTQLSILESVIGLECALERLPELFMLFTKLFDMNASIGKSSKTANQLPDGSKKFDLAEKKSKREFSGNNQNLQKDHKDGSDNAKAQVSEVLQDLWLWVGKMYLRAEIFDDAEYCIIEAESVHEPNFKTFTGLGLLTFQTRTGLASREIEKAMSEFQQNDRNPKNSYGETLLVFAMLIFLLPEGKKDYFTSKNDELAYLNRVKIYLENYSLCWPYGNRDSNVWWYLSILYETLDNKVLLSQSLWECISLEDFKPARDFNSFLHFESSI